MHERVYRQWCTDVSEAFILLYQILNWKKPQKKKIKQTNLHFLFESHDPHHMRTLHKNSGGRGFPSGHARDGCLRTGTKLLIPDFPGSHVPLNASFHAYTEHNKVFFFTAYSLLALFFFKIWDCIYIKTIYCYGIQSIQNDSQLLLPTKWRINASSVYSNSVFNPFPFNLENQFGCVYSWKPSPLLKGPPAWICCRVVNRLSTEIY